MFNWLEHGEAKSDGASEAVPEGEGTTEDYVYSISEGQSEKDCTHSHAVSSQLMDNQDAFQVRNGYQTMFRFIFNKLYILELKPWLLVPLALYFCLARGVLDFYSKGQPVLGVKL